MSASLATVNPSPDLAKEASPACPDFDHAESMDIDMLQDILEADEYDMQLHIQAPLIENLDAACENLIFKSNKWVSIILTLVLQNRMEQH
jgi:hypothetical protein